MSVFKYATCLYINMHACLCMLVPYMTQITYISPQTLRVSFPQIATWQYAGSCAAIRGPSALMYNVEDFHVRMRQVRRNPYEF